MIYNIAFGKADIKSLKKLNDKDKMLVRDTVELLASGAELLPKYKDHALKGQYLGFRECHVKPDLLLVYRKNNDILELYLLDVGSHSDLF